MKISSELVTINVVNTIIIIVTVAGPSTRSPSVVLSYSAQMSVNIYPWTVHIFMSIADLVTMHVINFIH